MNIVECKHCHRKVKVALYFSNARIYTNKDLINFGSDDYRAYVDGRAICPVCGKEIQEVFRHEITAEDITRLCVVDAEGET